MATAEFAAYRVLEAAEAKRVRLARDWEHAERAFIEEPRIRTSGSLWWKTSYLASRADCAYLYEHGHYPDAGEHDWWSFPYKSTLRDKYEGKITRAVRIKALCLALPTLLAPVRLDEGEVAFLGLSAK